MSDWQIAHEEGYPIKHTVARSRSLAWLAFRNLIEPHAKLENFAARRRREGYRAVRVTVPNCGFHLKPTIFGGSARAGKTVACPPTHTLASTEPHDPAAAADRLTGNETAGEIVEKAHEVDALRSRAAALRAIADRFDAEELRAQTMAASKEDTRSGSFDRVAGTHVASALARLDAPVTK